MKTKDASRGTEISFLIEEMEKNGVVFSVDAGKIRLHASVTDALRPDAVAALREHKSEAMVYLTCRKTYLAALESPGAAKLQNSQAKPEPLPRDPGEATARCGSTWCAGCYEVEAGVSSHPPKCGKNFSRLIN
jgi:hypothetical protein